MFVYDPMVLPWWTVPLTVTYNIDDYSCNYGPSYCGCGRISVFSPDANFDFSFYVECAILTGRMMLLVDEAWVSSMLRDHPGTIFEGVCVARYEARVVALMRCVAVVLYGTS